VSRRRASAQRSASHFPGLERLVDLGGNRYQLHFEPLADFSQTPRADRDAAIRAAMQHYADRLTHYCRLAPYNWFNFFDFWQKK